MFIESQPGAELRGGLLESNSGSHHEVENLDRFLNPPLEETVAEAKARVRREASEK